jgi:hypothetical protein
MFAFAPPTPARKAKIDVAIGGAELDVRAKSTVYDVFRFEVNTCES